MHFWHTLHRHMHYAFMADTYQSWLSLAGSACLSEIFSTPTISGPSSSQLLEKDNIWMFTIFLDMLIWNKVTSLVDVLYQNYHTLTQRFCRQGTDIQFVFPKNPPPWVWGTAEDVEVGSKGFPLLQGVGQVLEQSLRQEESSLAIDNIVQVLNFKMQKEFKIISEGKNLQCHRGRRRCP